MKVLKDGNRVPRASELCLGSMFETMLTFCLGILKCLRVSCCLIEIYEAAKEKRERSLLRLKGMQLFTNARF